MWIRVSTHHILCIMLVWTVSCSVMVISPKDGNSTRHWRLNQFHTQNENDPLSLEEVDSSAVSIYESISIIEKSREEMGGPDFDDSESSLNKIYGTTIISQPKTEVQTIRGTWKKGKRKIEKRKAVEKRVEEIISAAPIQFVPFAERWPFVVEYHHYHTKVSDADLKKRFEWLNSMSIELNEAPRIADSKYIVYYPHKAGLGNTISAWSEVLLIALYTRRFSLLYNWKDILLYYQTPFDHLVPSSRGFLHSNETLYTGSGTNCGLDLESILNGTDNHRYIVFRSYCGIIHYFIHTPYLNKWMQAHGIIRNKRESELENTHRLLQFLFVDILIPFPSVWDTVEKFKEDNEWNEKIVIGVHIRTGLLDRGGRWGRFLEKEDIRMFAIEAERYSKKLKRAYPTKQVKWFVLADDERVKQQFAEIAGEYYLTREIKVLHSKDGDVDGIGSSLVDSYLLSECKVLILTSKSTYGYLAKHRCEAVQKSIRPGYYKQMKE